MNANPVLAQVTRGNIVESFHRASYAITDNRGTLLSSAGDIQRPIFPRSAIKALQALALIESGAAQAYQFTDEEISVACASHNGEAHHINAVRSMLRKSGVNEHKLECGLHWPTHAPAASLLAASNQKPGNIHNNCSGKHAAMLATAHYLGEKLDNYIDISHPVQQRIQAIISQFCQYDASTAPCGIDGCSVPTWAIPLEKIACGFAMLSNNSHDNWQWSNASSTIIKSVRAAPQMVAGTGRFCTKIMNDVPRLFAKTGAEGVYCGVIQHAGIGIAVKCDDGATRAAEVIFAKIISKLPVWNKEEKAILSTYSSSELKNRNEIVTGDISACV
ncbi:MAG: asparaginase [Hyphomicrobiales bacterium]|nr:asparaginase [Hyphomicrobiales bacterium]